jgi:hypothetical protein
LKKKEERIKEDENNSSIRCSTINSMIHEHEAWGAIKKGHYCDGGEGE